MKSNKIALLFLILAFLAGCSSGGSSGGGTSVPSITLDHIIVTPSTADLAMGMSQQFTAVGVYSDNSTPILTSSVAWSSSAPNVATISSTGSVSLVSIGTTTITASLGNVSGAATLTVTAPKLLSISVAPSDTTIQSGKTQQYTASGTYTDNVQSNITASVTWSSSAPDVATIDNSGLAASPSVSASTATTATTVITATQGTISGSAILTVMGGSAPVAANIMPITVNGSLCDQNNSANYLNKPCVSVTVCTPGTSTCETVKDILLDTGSYGLRIFKQALTVSLFAIASSNSGSLATCAQFADGSSEWGPVQLADVFLGSELAANVPIQLIDATFGTAPASCGTPDLNPSAAGLNGILGVGLFAQDCGTYCETVATPLYFSCNGATCTETTVPLVDQVSNPVVSLPTDSNGVIVQLPSVASSGTTSVNGILVLGIDTESNNKSSGITTYSADQYGQIVAIFNGIIYGGIIDSGSNGLFFPSPSGSLLPDCGSANTGWFCPSTFTNLSATNEGSSGTPSNNVMFQIGNFDSLTSSGANWVFSNIGGAAPGIFDWGLPFYFGRNVYVGFENPPGSSKGQYFGY